MPVLSLLRRFNRALLSAAGWGVIAAMAVIAVVIPYAVFARYVLKNMPFWSDEIALFSLVWASMLGAAISLDKGYQVGINTLLEKTARAVSGFLQVFGLCFMLFFLAAAGLYGLRQAVINLQQLSSALRVPMAVPYLALPAGFLLMMLITLERLLEFVLRVDRAPRTGQKEPG